MTTAPFTAVRTECTPINFNYTVKFDRTITSPKEWQEEIDTIRLTKAGDYVTVYVNTNGGSIATLTEILHAIDSSEAYFHCVLAGNAYSAGGPIMLACDSVEVGKFADCMIHTSQSGYGGSSDALKSYSDHTAKTADKLLRECYEGFCTDEELDQALMGREFWFDADEIVRRLELRDLYRQEKYKSEITPDIISENISSMTQDLIFSAEQLNLEPSELLSLLTESLSDTLMGEEVPLEEQSKPWFKQFTTQYDDLFLNVDEEGYLNFGDHNYKDFQTVYDIGDYSREFYLEMAMMLEVKHAHNISTEKLVKRLDNKIQELLAEADK